MIDTYTCIEGQLQMREKFNPASEVCVSTSVWRKQKEDLLDSDTHFVGVVIETIYYIGEEYPEMGKTSKI